MATVAAPARLRVSKTTLSMFLRTRCDKELFLSLHDKATMAAAGLPQPIKRPGIGILAVEGREFETDRNDQLVRLFGPLVRCNQSGGRYADVDLHATLTALTGAPALILQGKFSVAQHQSSVLGRIGLAATDIGIIPPIADFIPDVFYVRPPLDSDVEVLPDGGRSPIDATAERRLAISILDIKHTGEANPSYCSEIALYALMLANWLELHPNLAGRLYVSEDARLWTRYNQVDSILQRLERAGGATPTQLLEGLVADSEYAQLRFYLPAIRGFFEDVARVVRIGSTSTGAGWTGLDWHITGSCSACDWLGDRRHMGQSQRQVVDGNPSHYCMPLAEATGHLCLVPGITRGAKKVLHQNTVNDTNGLANASGHPAFRLHTLLKKEAKSLPARSAAITTNTLSRDTSGAIASLVPSANLLIYASINFDSSSGFLTGLSLSGIATAFVSGQAPRRFRAVPFVVDQKSLSAEWVALEGFLTQIANWIETAEQIVGTNVTGQIHFWEQRQFEELCNAMGRHLPRVLGLAARKARAMAWVFPAEEMLERPEALDAATIVTVEDIVRRLVFAPSRHVITLFDTVEHYRRGSSSPAVHDSYYREYLSNGIPRERIYEIWANTPQVKRGTTSIPRNTIISQYSDALSRQSSALEGVCERLRDDYRGQFRAKATRIPSSVPLGATRVAFDGKLWLWWDELDFNASQLEAHIRLSMDGDRLEATYESIVLRNGTHAGGDLYDFDVAPTSSEAKFKEDSMLTLGKIGVPGMPLQRIAGVVRAGAPPYAGNSDLLMRPFWSGVEARLVTFDRVNNRARVRLACSEPGLFPYLVSNSIFPLLDDVFLVEAKKPKLFNWAEFSRPILEAIGSPSIATPDQNAARAMGFNPPARPRTASPETPAARLLWNPAGLQQRVVAPATTATALAAQAQLDHDLNDSQRDAVTHCVEKALTVIWGPPGTGKTSTLAAMLDAITSHAAGTRTPIAILVTGPTYKAVEEVMHRAAKYISKQGTTPCTMYMGYSRGRSIPAAPAGLTAHVSYNSMVFENGDLNLANCLSSLVAGSGVTIVGCQVRQGRQFARRIASSPLHPVFDLVVIDESSQVPVGHALAAFSGLKDESRVVIAGDHLQMPPITSIEPPTEAKYLVGSIQTYLLSRPFATQVTRCVLEKNYRSADHIVEFARRIGYPQQLTAEYPLTRLHLLQPLPDQLAYPQGFPWSRAFNTVLAPTTRVATVLHADELSSQGNQYEAQLVASLVAGLRHSVSASLDNWRHPSPIHAPPTALEFWTRCVGVVTPHRAQRALVVQALTSIWPTEADLIAEAVDTVERFQGGERHSIIVTFGVADVDVIGGEEAFLMQLERTNVAISRSMAKCIVVMPSALAAHIPEDKRALETAFALKDYVEEFCNLRINDTVSGSQGTRMLQVRYR